MTDTTKQDALMKAAKELYDAILLIAESPASHETMKFEYCLATVEAIAAVMESKDA